MLRVLMAVVASCQFCNGQELGSAEAARMMADMENRRIMAEADWNASTKLSYLPVTPKYKDVKSSDFSKAETGWVGEISGSVFTVLNVISDQECLLRNKSGAILWLKNHPKKELATDQTVSVVGPIVCAGAQSYDTVGGSVRTVKVFNLISDRKKIDEYSKKIADTARLLGIKNRIIDYVWGGTKMVSVDKMDRQQLKQYKSVLEKAERLIKAGKIDGKQAMAISKTKFEFDSEESKAIAMDEIKALLSQIPK